MENKSNVTELLNTIFDGRAYDKDSSEALLSALRMADEKGKDAFYRKLDKCRKTLDNCPEEFGRPIGAFMAGEMRRYLDEEPDETSLCNFEFLCDVCRFFINDELISLLKEAMMVFPTGGEARIGYYAAVTLLTLGEDIPEEAMRRIAGDLTQAYWLYVKMDELGCLSRYPAEYASEEYLAKSDMVQWLMFPTELGVAPDEIELIGKVEKNDEVFHVFRYMSNHESMNDDDRGKWLVGWSGNRGGTFSHFAPYSEFKRITKAGTLKAIQKSI